MSKGKIGFIGLGIMGSRMASNLVDAGYDVDVWNRSRMKARPLEEKGSRYLSPAELAAESDVLITMLAHPQAVSETMLGESGALSSMKPGTLWIDTSTVPPSFSAKESDEARRRELRFLDAPVAGSKAPAESGELVFLVGGEKRDIEEAAPLFDVMGKAVKHIGENGKGAAMKMVINYMLAISMAGFSEAAALAEAEGISSDVVFDTLLGGPVAAPFLSGKREKMEAGDMEADFPLKWMHKDLNLVSLTAYESNQPMPLANLTKELFALARQAGYGEADFSAIYSYFNEKK